MYTRDVFTAVDELRLLTRQLRAALSFREQLEALMADGTQAVSDLAAAIDAAVDRIQVDFDELKRQLAEAKSLSAEDRAALEATITGIEDQVARIGTVDPDPNFPAVPPPEPPPAP